MGSVKFRDPFHEANHRRKAGAMTSGPRELSEREDIAEQMIGTGKLVRDRSTEEKSEWWDSVLEAADDAPSLSYFLDDSTIG